MHGPGKLSWHLALAEPQALPDSARRLHRACCSYNCPIAIDVRAHAWRGAVFPHSLPRHHGNKHRNKCTACHPASNDFRSYTCYGCHRHDPSKTAKRHAKYGILNVDICAIGHPTARKHEDQPPRKGGLPTLGTGES